MYINEIYIGQLLVVKKAEEFIDEVSDDMKQWCGRVVTVKVIERNGSSDDDIPVIRLEECPEEEWYIEDFEKESPYQNVRRPDYMKSPDYPFYTPSNKSNVQFIIPEYAVKKINPNKAFKIKKSGKSLCKNYHEKIKIEGMSTGRISQAEKNPCGEVKVHEDKRVIEYNAEAKRFEYVPIDTSGYATINTTPSQLDEAEYYIMGTECIIKTKKKDE